MTRFGPIWSYTISWQYCCCRRSTHQLAFQLHVHYRGRALKRRNECQVVFIWRVNIECSLSLDLKCVFRIFGFSLKRWLPPTIEEPCSFSIAIRCYDRSIRITTIYVLDRKIRLWQVYPCNRSIPSSFLRLLRRECPCSKLCPPTTDKRLFSKYF